MRCPRCQADIPQGARFCSNCGSPLAQRCLNCGVELALEARYCHACGQSVNQQTAEDEARQARLAATAPGSLVKKVRASPLSREHKIVTVLFADVVGSTELSGKVDPESWTEIINGAFDRITPAVFRYEGTVARTQGDALIAFFGAPIAHEDDPIRAVLAAQEALEYIFTYSEQLRQHFGLDFSMRFCLNTGPVVLGPVGNDLLYEFTAESGTVNLAARLKFEALPMAVVITEHTHRFIAPFFECSDLGKVYGIEKDQLIQVLRVLGERAEPGSLRGISGLESPMVGRGQELKSLVQLCTAMYSGLGRVAIILGEPGLGKTRLIAEWQSAIADLGRSPAPHWAGGSSLSFGQGIPYHLLTGLLHALLGLPEATGEEQSQQALFTLLNDLFGDPLQPPVLDVYACLGNLLGIDLETEARQIVDVLDPQGLQAQYLVALRKTLVALSRSRPLVLVLEDLHWCDPSSAEIFVKLLPIASTNPILFCLATRPERASPGWSLVRTARELLGNSLVELYLEPLSERHSRQLVSNLLDIDALPESMRTMILTRAEGNPFFVEEIVRMLIEQNAIVREGPGWVAGEGIQNLAIPDNLHGLLMARIDRLPDEGKRTLRVASVVGRQFPVKVLSEVLERDIESADAGGEVTFQALTKLESAGLIRVAQFEPDLEYLFRHSLVQDAAYASILAAERRQLHLAVAETVELMYPERLSSPDLAPRLGRHFSEAGDGERALKYYLLAGQAALASYANHEAEDYFRTGLELATSFTSRLSLLSGLGEAISNQSRFLDAIEVWCEAIRLAKKAEALPHVAALYARSARAAWWAGEYSLSLKLCLEGIQDTTGAPANADQALLVHETARAYYFNGVPDQAEIYCLQALKMAEQLGDLAVQADSLTTLAILPNQDPEITVDALMKAIELAESAGLLVTASRAHFNAGSMRRGLFGDMEGASFHYQKSLEIARKRGVAQEQLFALGALLSVSLELGKLNELEAMLPQFEELIQSLTDQRLARLELKIFQAIIQVMRGEWREAHYDIQMSMDEIRNAGNLQNLLNLGMTNVSGAIEAYWMGENVDLAQVEAQLSEPLDLCGRGIGNRSWPLVYLAIIRVIQGNLDESQKILDQAFLAAGDRHELWLDILLFCAKGILEAAQKRWEESFSDFQQAYKVVSSAGQRWIGGRVLLRWSEALVERGEPADLDRALGLLREAVALFESMQAPVYLGFIEQQRKNIRKRMLVQATDQIGIAREMTIAGQIQRGFLPDKLPDLPGWSLAAVLVPARETSGDYYDFIPLPDGRLAIVVADVTDKGAGAAIFMASSRTLIRTYTEQFPGDPARVLEYANHRLKLDTHAGLFVTMFYAVLDPGAGTLRYCNAGHNPPFVFCSEPGYEPEILSKTGVPLGIMDGEEWATGNLEMRPGDWLVLYTDGVTEAQNEAGEYYEERRIQDFFETKLQQGGGEQMEAAQILADQLENIKTFIGAQSYSDDLTMVVIGRR